jgi:hypothetical protein
MADESPTIDEIQRQNKCLRRCGNEFLDFENMIVDLHYGGKMPLGEALARLAEARGLHEQCLERCIPIGRYFTNAQKVKFEKCRNAGFAFTAAGLVCTENLNPDVMVMKSTKDRVGFDASSQLNRTRDRRIFLQ